MQHNITGTGVALVTPFRKDKSIDFSAFEKLISHILPHINFLVAMGTTSEYPTLSKNEYCAVLNFIKDSSNGKYPIVVGIGGNNTKNVTETIKSFDFDNISAILSVAPYYNKPTQKGLYEHFKNIAQQAPVPIILYNVPGRTSCNIMPETVLKLANDFENIIGIKEASGNLVQIMEILKHKPKHFSVYSGDDALTLPMIALGAQGVISVTANAVPKTFSEMVNHALNNNLKEANNLHYSMLELFEALFIDGNPAGIKAALSILNITSENVRLPLVKATKATKNKIDTLLKGMQEFL